MLEVRVPGGAPEAGKEAQEEPREGGSGTAPGGSTGSEGDGSADWRR